MREKKWIDCPVCGAKKTMRAQKGLTEDLKPKGYPPLHITGLSGQFCSRCGDGFWSLSSEKKITQAIIKHHSIHDATRTYASDVVSVQEAAKLLRVSVQGIHKMMTEGRLRSVYVAGRRVPVRSDLMEKAKPTPKRRASTA